MLLVGPHSLRLPDMSMKYVAVWEVSRFGVSDLGKLTVTCRDTVPMVTPTTGDLISCRLENFY